MISTLLASHGSDKVSRHSYGPLYDSIFDELKQNISVLEIGILDGASVSAWLAHPSVLRVAAIDVNPKFIHGVTVYVGDAYTPEMISRVRGKFDLIIDDGSHLYRHQTFFLTMYQELLSSRGVMVCEDVQARYLDTMKRFAETVGGIDVIQYGPDDDTIALRKKHDGYYDHGN